MARRLLWLGVCYTWNEIRFDMVCERIVYVAVVWVRIVDVSKATTYYSIQGHS